MNLPKLGHLSTSRIVTENFTGYDHRLRVRDGALFDMKNLTSDHAPMLASRRPRSLKATLTNPGGIIEKDALCYVAGGTLYVNGNPTALTGLSAGEKQLVSMGASVVIFPDKKYYNTADPSDCGNLEASWEISNATVLYTPCDVDGNPYEIGSTGADEPTNPDNGDLWINTGDGGNSLMQWSSAQLAWVAIETVYTRIKFTTMNQIPTLFKQYDGVTISGNENEDLNGDKVLYGVGGSDSAQDYIVVVGLIGEEVTKENVTKIKIERKLPKLDYVCECQNRLWGCYYGLDGGKVLNEIYCSALGDPKNWRQYLGLSTDSWTASVGSDGPWTGAIGYLGNPCFFKENRAHVVSVSPQGAHRLDEIVCRGVQKGSSKSLCVVGETLFYKSRTDVCAWQGGFPQGVSEALGDEKYYNAVAGGFGKKYYISMNTNSDATLGTWHLFVYDSAKGIWSREDELHAMQFARVDDSLFCIESGTSKLWDLQGADGTPETSVHWMAESGILYTEYTDRKYLSRYDFKLKLEAGGRMTVWIQYDSSGDWTMEGEILGSGLKTVVLPIRPRRCDHMKIRLIGSGELRLFSITRILRIGSDRG